MFREAPARFVARKGGLCGRFGGEEGAKWGDFAKKSTFFEKKDADCLVF